MHSGNENSLTKKLDSHKFLSKSEEDRVQEIEIERYSSLNECVWEREREREREADIKTNPVWSSEQTSFYL